MKKFSFMLISMIVMFAFLPMAGKALKIPVFSGQESADESMDHTIVKQYDYQIKEIPDLEQIPLSATAPLADSWKLTTNQWNIFTPREMYIASDTYGGYIPVVSQPGLLGHVVYKVKHQDTVEFISAGNGMAKIKKGNKTGYIPTSYLTKDKPGKLFLPNTPPSMPPEQAGDISIYIYKSKRELELRSNGIPIGKYSIGLGGDPNLTKNREGDSKTPEGEYYITVKNTNSKFYLSLGLSYPNIGDAQRGLDAGIITQEEYNQIKNAIEQKGQPSWNTALGGAIMIHGHGGTSDWTAGCIAVDNSVMDYLWAYCKQGTPVTIVP